MFWNKLNVDKKFLKSFVVSTSMDSILDTVTEPNEKLTSETIRIDGTQMVSIPWRIFISNVIFLS